MQDKSLAECARCAQACEPGCPRGDKEVFGRDLECCFLQKMNVPSTNLCCFQPALELQQRLWGRALGWAAAHPAALGGTCSSGHGRGWCCPPGLAPGRSLGVRWFVLLSPGVQSAGSALCSIICAVQMLQPGQSQALDEGSVVLGGDSSQCAAGQPILSCQNTSLWSCFQNLAGFLYRAPGPIPGGDPELLCFSKGFSPHLQSKFAAAFPLFEHCRPD